MILNVMYMINEFMYLGYGKVIKDDDFWRCIFELSKSNSSIAMWIGYKGMIPCSCTDNRSKCIPISELFMDMIRDAGRYGFHPLGIRSLRYALENLGFVFKADVLYYIEYGSYIPSVRKLNSFISEFISEYPIDREITVKDLYDNYINWADTPCSLRSFTKELRVLGYNVCRLSIGYVVKPSLPIADDLDAFLEYKEKRCPSTDEFINVKDAYIWYQEYCESCNLLCIPKQNFFRRLTKMGFRIIHKVDGNYINL